MPLSKFVLNVSSGVLLGVALVGYSTYSYAAVFFSQLVCLIFDCVALCL